MYYSSKRQAFLVDQGYAFKVITHLQGIEKLPGLAYATIEEKEKLLAEVMRQNSEAGQEEGDDFDGAKLSYNAASKKSARYLRTTGKPSGLAGGDKMAYTEYDKSRNKELKAGKGQSNPFFRKMHRENEKRRKEQNNMKQ